MPLSQVVAQARARGDSNYADLLARAHPVPGTGIDFGALGTVLGWALAVYVVANVLALPRACCSPGRCNLAVRQLRSDVEDKLARLPLPYVDGQPAASCSAGSRTTSTTSPRACSRR